MCALFLHSSVTNLHHFQLGGHYVAYTALPSLAPIDPSSEKSLGSVTVHPDQPSVSKPGNLDQKAHRKWAYISDTVVRLATLDEVLKAKAYICMYERI